MNAHRNLYLVVLASTVCVFLFIHTLLLLIRNENILRPLKNKGSAITVNAAAMAIPVYPAAIPVSFTVIQMRFFNRYLGVWHTNDSVSVITPWYTRQLISGGWKLSIPPAQLHTESPQNLVFRKGWNNQLNLSVVPSVDQTGTDITVNYGPEYYPDDILSDHYIYRP